MKQRILVLAVVLASACKMPQRDLSVHLTIDGQLEERFTARVTHSEQILGDLQVLNVHLEPEDSRRWSQDFPALGTSSLKIGDKVYCRDTVVSNNRTGDHVRVCTADKVR